MRRRNWIRCVMLCLFLPLFCCVSGCRTAENDGPKNPEQNQNNGQVPGEGQYYGQDDIVLSVFWPPSKGYTEQVQYDYLKEAHIDLLEWNSDPIFTDEETLAKTLELCEKNGLKITGGLYMIDNGCVEFIEDVEA